MLLNRLGLVTVLLMITHYASGQVNRYMVFFKDKAGTPFSISDPSAYLSSKAIERRVNQSILVTAIDLPVNPDYVQQLRQAGINVFFKTRWMNGVLVQCDATLVTTIEAFDFVQAIEKVAPDAKLLTNLRSAAVGKKKTTATSAVVTNTQLHLIGLDQMHSSGFLGAGRLIALLDAGFPGVNTAAPFQHLFTNNQINTDVSYDFVYNTTSVFQYDAHGTEVLSTIAAYNEASFVGGAYEANFQLYVTEDVSSEYRIEEYNWLFAAERADSAGVDIISSSLGYRDFDDATMNYKAADLDGKTAVITRAAQFAADRGILVVCSAGNEGATAWRLITPPADAKDILAIANVNAQSERNLTSSIGPEGVIKPDLAALGTSVAVVTPSGNLSAASGTSLAAPLITSLVAGLWQQHPDFSNKQIMDALRLTASQAHQPDNFLGYGIPNYKAVANYLNFVPQQNTFEVYPNPIVNDTLHIRPKSPEEITSCHMQIITTQGKVVGDQLIEFSWLNPVYTMSLASLSTGFYFIRIWLNDQAFVFKVIKT